jgi:hypothetical protein
MFYPLTNAYCSKEMRRSVKSWSLVVRIPVASFITRFRSEMGRKPSAVSTSSFFERKEINVQLSPSRVATPS